MAENTFLFDLDGTIWNSYTWYAGVLSAHSDLDFSETVKRLFSGESIVNIARNCGLSNTALNKALADTIEPLELYPSVREVLEELGRRNVRMGIITNIPGRIAKPLLANLDLLGFFSTTVYAARKPSPGGILKAVGELGLDDMGGVIYVGDTESDSSAASRAQVQFAWAEYGYSNQCPPNTDVILETFSDVLAL